MYIFDLLNLFEAQTTGMCGFFESHVARCPRGLGRAAAHVTPLKSTSISIVELVVDRRLIGSFMNYIYSLTRHPQSDIVLTNCA